MTIKRSILHAWMAGIVDGEGCLTICKQIRKGRPSPAFRESIMISNTDPAIVAPFAYVWGGGIYTIIDKRIEKKWTDALTWHCPENRAVAFLSAMIPHLRAKRPQAELILEFIALKKTFVRHHVRIPGTNLVKGSAPLSVEEITAREQFWNSVRALNAKGPYARRLKIAGEQ